MLLTTLVDFDLWMLWLESEGRRLVLKYKFDEVEPEFDAAMKDAIFNNIDTTIASHLISSFQDKRKTWRTVLDAVKVKHQQLSRPPDIQAAFAAVRLYTPADSFGVARELKRLAKYVNGDSEFLVQHFVNAITDYDFKLLIQQRVSSSVKSDIDDLADFLSQMPPKPMSYAAASINTNGKSFNSNVWRTRECYNCGKVGHGARFCRATKNKCTFCDKLGHLEKFCNQKN